MMPGTWVPGPHGSGVIPDCLGVPKLATYFAQRISQDPDEVEV